jgi:hypothetical protein
MKLTVNEKPVSAEVEGDTTLKQLLETLDQEGELPHGEAVIDVEIDGETFESGNLKPDCNPVIDASSQLTVRTGDLRQCAQRLVEQASSTLTTLGEATIEVSRRFEQGPATEANRHLFRLLDAIQNFFSHLASIEKSCQLENRFLESHPEILEQLSETLGRIQTVQESENWEALADCLREELRPALGTTRNLLQDYGRSAKE